MCPWNEGKAQTVVNYDEPARGKREALAVSAGDHFAAQSRPANQRAGIFTRTEGLTGRAIRLMFQRSEGRATVEYEWDRDKDESNWRKHGVSFDHAVMAIEDEFAIEDIDDYGAEDRWNLLGVCDGVILQVTYTMRGERIRIILAVRATSRALKYSRTAPSGPFQSSRCVL
jgi:uncharacterized protein